MKKIFSLVGVIVIGVMLLALIDHTLGVEFVNSVTPLARIIHTATYEAWGAVIFVTYLELYLV